MTTTQEIKLKIQSAIKNSDVIVEDISGQGKNFAVDVVSETFEGKSFVKQHQMIYQAIGDKLKNEVHALQINTSTPCKNN